MKKIIETLEVIGTVALVSAGIGLTASVAVTVTAAIQGVVCRG